VFHDAARPAHAFGDVNTLAGQSRASTRNQRRSRAIDWPDK
jgi:hypothetical protein